MTKSIDFFPPQSPIKQRILEFARRQGLTKRELYERTGISRGTLESPSGITEDILMKFMIEFPQVSVAWLIEGEGSMMRTERAERHMQDRVRLLDEQNRELQDTIDELHRHRIPLVTEHVAAGFGSADFLIRDDDVRDYYVVPRFRERRADFLIEVSGLSMQPRYNPGDIIACRILHDRTFLQWNQCHVIGTRWSGLIVKRLMPGNDASTIMAVSDNPDYPPFAIPTDEITGLAVVVGTIGGE